MTEGPTIDERLRRAGQPVLPRTAWLEIDLDALAANLATIRSWLPGGVAVLPVVKADAYGHGAIPVAATLVEAGAEGLCVAALDEALVLREAGIEAPIRVLFPIPPAAAVEAAAHDVAVAAGDHDLLEASLAAVARTAQDGGGGAGRRPLRLEVEVETGLGRGGFAGDALVDALRTIDAAPSAAAAGLWTHLQAAEDAAITAEQVHRFDAAVASIETAGLAIPARHVAASGGLLLDVAPAHDAVRPGLAIYGLVPDELLDPGPPPPRAAELRPVLSLHARPVRVADLPAGHGISYGPTYRTTRPSRIATLPLGYGDGWPRSLSNLAVALVRGVRVPVVGNVAMDAMMVDVTDVPGRPVTVEDEFVLIGRQGDGEIPAAEVARLRTTNSWEVVTAMSRRLTRVYHASAGRVGFRSLISREDRWLGSNSGTATSATSRSTPS